MTAVRAGPELAPQLRAALARRLLELDGYEAAPLQPRCSSTEAEESLRKIMVRYRHGIIKKNLGREDVSQLLHAAESVASHADWDDLRFVDSLNAVYEVWKGDFENEARLSFLGIYRRALQSLTDS